MYGSLALERGPKGLSPTLRNAALLAIAAFIFIAIRPNTGVRHDGILYAAQALFRLQPEIFGGDVFFKFGSQENFTVFGRIYALLISQLGFTGASLFLLALAQVLFFTATVVWTRAALPASLAFAGLVAVCLSNGGYGGLMIFHYAESFVTARPMAEVLVLFSLPFMLAGKRWISLGLILAGVATHPLIALPALVVWWIAQVLEDRRWVWLAVAVSAAAVLLGLAGVAPFTDLLVRQADEWRAAIESRTNQVFVTMWTGYDYMMLATDVALLCWIWLTLEDGPLRRLVLCVLGAGAACFGASLIGADLAGNVLITALQLWRVQWLMHFVAMSLIALVLVRLLRGGNVAILAAILLTYAALNRGLITGGLAMLGAIVLGWLAAKRRQIDIDRRLVYTVGLALLGGMLVMWNNNVTWELSVGEFRSAGEVAPLLDVVVQYLRKPAMGPLLLAAILAAALVRWPRSPVVAVLVVAAASAMAAHTWDQRGTWTRIIESYAEGDHPFSKYIAPTEEVYWSDEALAPWMMLHRRTYVSSAQMAGVAFNRESGEQMERRSRVVALFEFQRDICGLFNAVKTSNQQACEPDVMTMRTACETDPKLSWLITTYSLEQAWTASWNAEYKGRPYRKYFLYGCRQLLGDKARNPS